MINLSGEKSFFFNQKKSNFHKWMGWFSEEKIFGKIWLSYDQKQKFRGAEFFQVFKNVCKGPKSDFMVLNKNNILSPTSRQSHGLSQFKTSFFAHAKILPLSGFFGHANFGQLAHFLCTKWLNIKTEIDQASKMKNIDLGQTRWWLAAGTSGTCLAASCQTSKPSTQEGQIWWQIIGLILS